MTEYINISVPSKPEMIREDKTKGTYEITGLFPGYGNTLGNALRRMLLSSIPGLAITTIRIKGVPHEFSVLNGVKEDVLSIILKLKNIRMTSESEIFPITIKLKKKGRGMVTAGDFKVPSQLKIVNKSLVLAEITDAKTELDIEAEVNKGIGFRAREDFEENSAVGSIVVDATFSPVRRSYYEVKNVRVGNRTDYNKLHIFIETDGSIAPREALERVIQTMIFQLESMVGFQSENKEQLEEIEKEAQENINTTPVEKLELTIGTVNTLKKNGVYTIENILSKGIVDILGISGIGDKSVEDIKESLERRGIVFKD